MKMLLKLNKKVWRTVLSIHLNHFTILFMNKEPIIKRYLNQNQKYNQNLKLKLKKNKSKLKKLSQNHK